MFKKLLLVLSLLSLMACTAKETPIVEPEVIVPVINTFRNQYDGSLLKAGDRQAYKAVAVIVNNSAVARPHYGLSKADVVYEVIKEKYIETRFFALFEGEFPEKVGPLRSIRVPFVRIFNEWQAALVHYGGSGPIAQNGSKNPASVNALDMLPKIYVPYRFDAVAGINDEYFFRTNDKPAPHNAFIALNDASQDFPDVWTQDHFIFDEVIYSTSEDNASTITLDYPTETANKVSYEFDISTGQYNRFINDKAHIDALYDEQIAATNIIVQYADHTEVNGYVLVEFLYSGEADFFIQGKHISGYWIKDWEDDTTHWKTDDGEDLVIVPGSTWIQIIPTDLKIEWE